MGDWKAYRQVGKALELFNLAEDPFEKIDLARSKPNLVAKMEAVIKEARQPLSTQ
jgi:arylsulfatase A-like enzyme